MGRALVRSLLLLVMMVACMRMASPASGLLTPGLLARVLHKDLLEGDMFNRRDQGTHGKPVVQPERVKEAQSDPVSKKLHRENRSLLVLPIINEAAAASFELVTDGFLGVVGHALKANFTILVPDAELGGFPELAKDMALTRRSGGYATFAYDDDSALLGVLSTHQPSAAVLVGGDERAKQLLEVFRGAAPGFPVYVLSSTGHVARDVQNDGSVLSFDDTIKNLVAEFRKKAGLALSDASIPYTSVGDRIVADLMSKVSFGI